MPAIDRELTQARRIHAALLAHAPEFLTDPTYRLTKLGPALAACKAAEDEVRRLEVSLQIARLTRRTTNTACWEIARRAFAVAHMPMDPRRSALLLRTMGYKTAQEKAKPGPKRPRAKSAGRRAK